MRKSNFLKFIDFLRTVKFASRLFFVKHPIVFFVPFHKIGGSETVHLNIIRSFPKHKCWVVFTNSSGGNYRKSFGAIANCLDCNAHGENSPVWKILACFINLKSGITVFGSNNRVYYRWVLPKINEKVYCVDLSHAFYYPDPGLEEEALPVVSLLDQRVCIMESLKEATCFLYDERGVPEKFKNRLRVIRNAINAPKFKSIPPDQRFAKKAICYVGRDSREKRLKVFIELANQFEDNFPEFSFHVLGPENIEKKSGNLHLHAPITEHHKVLEWINENASLLVIPSYREGFPMVIMEAMSLGVPALSVAVGSIPEIIRDGVNGWLSELSFDTEETVESLKLQLLNCMNAKETYERVATEALATFHRDFSMEKFTKAWQELLLPST